MRRLKGLKRKEIERHLDELGQVAGPGLGAAADEAMLAKLLEGDFDPDEWDK